MRRRYRAAYPPEFHRQMAELYRFGRSLQDLAKEFEPSLDTIADWVRLATALGVAAIDQRKRVRFQNVVDLVKQLGRKKQQG